MFYSNDHAPIHVHILKDGHEVKYNVDPVELVFDHGFKKHYILLIESVLGKVPIYNSLIPVVGAVSSCLCLHEVFYWKYVLAGALATAGIYIINKGR